MHAKADRQTPNGHAPNIWDEYPGSLDWVGGSIPGHSGIPAEPWVGPDVFIEGCMLREEA